MTAELYIGLMSGTSADGIDAVLVDLKEIQPKLIAARYMPYPISIRDEIKSLYQPSHNEIHRLATLDVVLGKTFAKAVLALLKKTSLKSKQIKAIGSHGQTIRHSPHRPHSFTLQIGDPNIIAAMTGITTIADFRRKDVACGGQGAPLVPLFHEQLFSKENHDRVIVNIGGIANITLLSSHFKKSPIAFDTGPGNTLLDAWIFKYRKQTMDKNGHFAESGVVQIDLLKKLLADPYFKRLPPKSTGFDYFNLTWLQKYLNTLKKKWQPADIQRTLTHLTAHSIMDAIKKYLKTGEILLCGGGVYNTCLVNTIKQEANSDFSIASTLQYGMHPDWIEASAFAYLAKQTLLGLPGNLPQVSGAKEKTILGGIYR